jgi:hypothetical protein
VVSNGGATILIRTPYGRGLPNPPPELRASVMIAGPHDFSRATWENGSFALETFLGWSDTNSVPADNRPSVLRQLVGNRRNVNRLKAASSALPISAAAESVLDGHAP